MFKQFQFYLNPRQFLASVALNIEKKNMSRQLTADLGYFCTGAHGRKLKYFQI